MQERQAIRTIKKVMPAVVSVLVAKHLEDIEKEIPPELYSKLPKTPDGKAKIPDDMVDDDGMVEIGGGSGFIVDASGIIATNKHVVGDTNAEYTILLNDGDRFHAKILTRDPIYDIALLKINTKKKLPVIALGDASKLDLGQGVIAIGNALGLFKNTVSLGIVSGLSRAIEAQADDKAPPQEMRGLIQTDAAINVGNSGGPLVDASGKAIGINSATVFGAQSIGFAIPVNIIKHDLKDLKKYGHIRRPYLGVRYLILDKKLAEKMRLPVGHGAFVINEGPKSHGVVPGSSADKAGVKEKDVILEINGEEITKDHPVQDCLRDLEVGDVAELLLLREKKKIKVKIKLTERE